MWVVFENAIEIVDAYTVWITLQWDTRKKNLVDGNLKYISKEQLKVSKQLNVRLEFYNL